VLRTQFVNDFVLLENFCNRDCTYCKLQKARFDPSAGPEGDSSGASEFQHAFSRATKVLAAMRSLYDTPILVLSGGEVSQFPGFLEFAAEQSPRYESVQILTNGQSGPEWVLQAHERISNLHMKFSLDGHTTALNVGRRYTDRDMAVMKDNLETCVSLGLSVELNCVLTRHNVAGLPGYVDWLRSLSETHIQLYIFPVRSREGMQASYKEVEASLTSLRGMAPGEPPLLPEGHLDALLEFYRNGRRTTRCLLPFVLVAGYDSGDVGACTLISSPRLPSLNEAPSAGRKQDTEVRLRSVLHTALTKAPPFRACGNCFLDYHVVNSALEGRITFEALAAIPLYSSPTVQARLKAVRENIQQLSADPFDEREQ